MPNEVVAVTDEIRKLAISNPKLAFMLTRGQPLEPRMYNVEIQFDTTAANQTIRNSQMDDKMFQMFWVQYMLYTIRRPSYNAGVFGAREQDEYCKLNPYISVDISIVGKGGPRHMTEGMVPLENIASPSSAPNPKALDWVLVEDQNISIDALNTRAFDAEGETPYVVDITLVGKELSGCQLPGCNWDDIVCQLRNEGMYPLAANPKMR
jgi:hypothetical protein